MTWLDDGCMGEVDVWSWWQGCCLHRCRSFIEEADCMLVAEVEFPAMELLLGGGVAGWWLGQLGLAVWRRRCWLELLKWPEWRARRWRSGAIYIYTHLYYIMQYSYLEFTTNF
ncbi:hypothetical protein KSP39_PZI010588 [Platanthera zijinensis]|uniref:Uncharacterized protein n=1 Tax=Platanthera zijinensis TaxID=2320716 RepID=A0AAP0G676_9ASPA